jgi:hypothetical protein
MVLMPVLPYCVPAVGVPVPAPAMRSVDALAEFVSPFGQPPDLGDAVSRSETTRFGAASGDERLVPAPAIPVVSARRPIWPAAVAAVYTLGFVFLASRMLVGWRQARPLVENRPRVSVSSLIAPEVGSPEGNRHPRSVFVSALVVTPLTVGVLSPRIILPLGWRTWPAEKLQAVLAHERAHITRHDPLIAFVAALNRCVFWFHPLAWWLERKLSTMAEHACDEATLRELGERRRTAYAEVLLDMAETARQAGGRFTWQGVGVVNRSSQIAQRIDRILKADLLREMSRVRKVVVAVASVAAIFVAVACHQAAPQGQTVTPLKEDPQVTAKLAQDQAARAYYGEVAAMTADQVKALEAALAGNPEDMAARKKLVAFYSWDRRPGVGWNEMIAGRRKQALWLIAHHPEDTLARDASPSSEHDPSGHAEARNLWLAYLKRTDVSAHGLRNAAAFLGGSDSQAAEQALLRGERLDPKGDSWIIGNVFYGGSWSNELGRLYAEVILGVVAPNQRFSSSAFSAEAAHSTYAREVRKKLEETKDVRILSSAAAELQSWVRFTRAGAALDFDADDLARLYLERAVALDPGFVWARQLQAGRRDNDRIRRAGALLKGVPLEQQYDTIAALPEAERFALLPGLADLAYMRGESDDFAHQEPARVKTYWDLCRRYAEDELKLAAKFKNDPDYPLAVNRANLALGVLALRAGDGREAIRYLHEAANVPGDSSIIEVMSLEYRLTDTLLKCGERDSVAAYFERTASLFPTASDRRLRDAAAIRVGRMPESYQRRMAQQ